MIFLKSILTIITLLSLIGYHVSSQTDYPRITVTYNIEIIKISEHSYIHVSYIDTLQYRRIASNGFILVNNGKALLFDTPMNEALTKDLVAWITDSLDAEITGFVPNHWHNDCMGGLGYLHHLGIRSYACDLTREIAESENLPVPKHEFSNPLTLKLDNLEVVCKYYGPAHSMDNIVVWVPSEKILFAGCMVKDMRTQNLGNTVDGDLNEYPETIKKIIKEYQDARIVIPGHGQYGGVELLKHTFDLATQ